MLMNKGSDKAGCYKVCNNDSLDRIVVSGKEASIGSIRISAPTCADDVTVMSEVTLK